MSKSLAASAVVLTLLLGCARDTDASGDDPPRSEGDDAGATDMDSDPATASSGGDMMGASGTTGGGSTGATSGGTTGSVAQDAGVPAPSPPATPGGGSGIPGLGTDAGFDPCNIPGLPPGFPPIPGLPEGGLMIPGCP